MDETKADWHFHEIRKHRIILIYDDFSVARCCWTVANDAFAVVEALAKETTLEGKRIIVCDIDGIWDEMIVVDGKFVRFEEIPFESLEEAVEAITA